MKDQFKNFLMFLEALEKQRVEYILIGGVAVIIHGIERLTRDIDIFIKMEEKNIERLKHALHSIFEDESIDEISLEELQEYAVIRYGTPDDFYIDIMARLGEFAGYEDLEYEVVRYMGINVRIATVETLYRLKKDTIRHKDKFDAAYLLELIKAGKSMVSNEKKPLKE